ncbi:hypothetical protein RhiirC2_779290 [Rhizophagus irregularis]|uniref:Uncharacterized protein n=1 Tax=Rhizophagus irregularis TaxID=588596 RepID=A0A2N1N9Z9_9GLOM|nr:hypothetical protein RhiirC2_779290 [Rhizophagus irregularis]
MTSSSPQLRPHKPSKRSSPYEKTSYKVTKSKYNLRGNKQSRASADDSETFPATEEDTDVPEESIMSDGAVFDDIITHHENTLPNDNNFSVRSYNPLNLISSFNVHNISSISSSLKNSKINNNTQKNSDKQKTKNNNNNNISSNSTNYNFNINNIPDEEHITNLHVINTDNQYFIDYLKIGTINIQSALDITKLVVWPIRPSL